MIPAVLDAVRGQVQELIAKLATTPELDLGMAETETLAMMRQLGARVLEVGLGARVPPATRWCPACGERVEAEGRRTKQVQTPLGWIAVPRSYVRCRRCGSAWCPVDGPLGLQRDSHSPGVRRMTSRVGALMPFAVAAETLRDVSGIQLSASTVRTVTEGVGQRQEQRRQEQIARAWREGWEPDRASRPDRWYVGMDGVRILGCDGQGREVKLGRIMRADASVRTQSWYVAGVESAEAFGRRLAVVAHDRGVDAAVPMAVLGDGAAWIWHLADEHFPQAVQIVDWFHASERVWALGRAMYGEDAPQLESWVAAQLTRLAAGEAIELATDWATRAVRGAAAAVRDEQVRYFTNQASRMAYDRYRAAGWAIGSGMIESGCKAVIGQRHKGAGMRWSDAGAQTVANVRVLLFNKEWDAYWAAA